MEKGLFTKVQFLEIQEDSEILDVLENFKTLKNKGGSTQFLEILENVGILEILSLPFVKRPLL